MANPIEEALARLINGGLADTELPEEVSPPVGKHTDERESRIIIGTTEAGTTTKTEAPTNAGTYEALDERVNDTRLTEKEHDFVSVVDMHWGMYGELLTVDKAFEDYGVPRARFIKCMGNPGVRAALEERGVSFRGIDYEDGWRSNAITPIQLLAAKSLLDITDGRSDKKKLQDLGVDTKVYNAWKRDPVFIGYLEKTATAMLHGSQHEAMLALIDKVRMGDTAAIKLYLEFTGKYTPKMITNGSASQFDVQTLLTRVLEIILEEVKDPDARDRIGQRLLNLGNANSMAGSMIDTSPIPIPEIMPPQELPEDLKELMASGQGVNI